MSNSPVDEARARLDALDRELFELLAERARVAEALLAWKRERAIAPRDPARERAMIAERRRWAEAEGLSPWLAEAVTRAVLVANRGPAEGDREHFLAVLGAATVPAPMDTTLPAAALGDRSLFPSLAARAYLAHAAVSPPSLAVRRAVDALLDAYAGGGALAFPSTIEQRARLRARLEALLGAEPRSVALVPNTSAGVTDVALCLPWREGDRVLLFEGEFPANVTPWQRAAELFRLEVRWLPADLFRTDPTRAFEALDAELARGVRLVALSQVQFQTGFRMPLREVSSRAHAQGAEVFVDAIQGVGAVPLDVRADGVDYLAAGSHKWLMGAEGAGLLYAAPERAKLLRPHVAGWLSHEDPVRFLLEGAGHLRYDRPLRARVDVVEGGTFAALSCAALDASVELLLGLGVANVHAHVNAYLDALEAGLVARGFQSLRAPEAAGRSCILGALPPPGAPDVPTLARRLAERGVVVSTPDGVLRFAPHWPNHASEVPAVLAALDEALRSPSPGPFPGA